MSAAIDSLTRDQTEARMGAIYERLKELGAKFRLSKADDQEYTELTAEFDELTAHEAQLSREEDLARAQARAQDNITRAEIARAAGEGGGAHRIERGSVDGCFDPGAGRDIVAERMRGGQRESALRTVERSLKAGTLDAGGADAVERLCEDGNELARSWMQRYVTDSGSPQYKSAFQKLMVHGEQRAGLEWTPAERAAFERVARLKQEQRAMSLTDSAGGYLVPFEVDFSINLVSSGSVNPLLQWARRVVSVSDIWHGINSSGVVSEWLAEAAEAADATPTLAEVAVPAYKASTWVPFSVEVAQDSVNMVGELGRLISDSQLQLLNEAWTVGGGVGGPTGIVTKLTGTSSVVNAATAGTIAAQDAWNLQNSLGSRWQANARWLGNLSAINALAALETSNGAIQFPSIQNEPRTLLGRTVGEASNLNGSLTAGTYPLIYGDWQQFVISQRVGTSVEFVPVVFGPNNRPSGQRGLWAWSRWGADCINTSAFRMLKL